MKFTIWKICLILNYISCLHNKYIQNVSEENTVISNIILKIVSGLKTQWQETALFYPLFFGAGKHQHIASQRYF
jgi:hypothetical protein